MAHPDFDGDDRKLVIAIDVGTTFSGAAFCLLVPGNKIEIKGVNRFPAQEHVGGDAKIPTVIWYDQGGSVMCAGAEATREGVHVEAEEQQWIKAEWFKIFFRPWDLDAPELRGVPPLPLGKTVVEVFADFLRYIFSCTRAYIQESYPAGELMWQSVEHEIQFILTHPNGYEGHQQGLVRQAAVLAGLVPNQEAARERISLVTEGEASLHYCIDHGLTTPTFAEGKGVMIVDAGGGTLDFSSYAQNGDEMMEIAASQCIYNGSVFVTTRAHLFFQDLLKDTRFEADVKTIAEQFDKKTKPSFRDPAESYYTRFAAVRETEADLNIRNGQLRVQGSDIAKFFEPSLDDIVGVIDQQTFALVGSNIGAVFLVGGFAASDYLFENVKQRLTPYAIEVYRPDSHINKAVAYGAVSYHVNHRVKSRVSRYTFGVPCSVPYRSRIPAHVQRERSKFQAISGAWYLPSAFNIILKRNTQVAETKEFRRPFSRARDNVDELRRVDTTIQCYRGINPSPEWFDQERELFTVMCRITANLDELCDTLQPRLAFDEHGNERTYYRIDFQIALLFGLTEFQAMVIWKDGDGNERRTPAAEVLFTVEEDVPLL